MKRDKYDEEPAAKQYVLNGTAAVSSVFSHYMLTHASKCLLFHDSLANFAESPKSFTFKSECGSVVFLCFFNPSCMGKKLQSNAEKLSILDPCPLAFLAKFVSYPRAAV